MLVWTDRLLMSDLTAPMWNVSYEEWCQPIWALNVFIWSEIDLAIYIKRVFKSQKFDAIESSERARTMQPKLYPTSRMDAVS